MPATLDSDTTFTGQADAPLFWWPPHVQTGHHHNSENEELALPSSSFEDECSKRCPLCSEMYADYVFEKMMDPSSAASVSFEALIADRLELRLFQVRSTRLQRFLRAFPSPQCASHRERFPVLPDEL